jgi:hypothetical protein
VAIEEGYDWAKKLIKRAASGEGVPALKRDKASVWRDDVEGAIGDDVD